MSINRRGLKAILSIIYTVFKTLSSNYSWYNGTFSKSKETKTALNQENKVFKVTVNMFKKPFTHYTAAN